MRIVLTTGGTGGHIFPALAVAQELRDRGAEVLFIGAEHGAEARIMREAGFDFFGLKVEGVLGRGFRAICASAKLASAVVPASIRLHRFQPRVVVGFGAYASFSVLAAAKLMGIPCALHEQNAVPGLTNRCFGPFVQKIFLSMPDRLGRFPKARCLMTGNPVRREILEISSLSRQVPGKNLLVLGGSQGSRVLNTLVLDSIVRLKQAGIRIRHQTGATDYERVRQAYAAKGISDELVSPFISDMRRAYEEADLVLCRSGATTIAELAVAGRPAVFVPFPFATHEHQRHNAETVVRAGGALMFAESELPSVDIGEQLQQLFLKPEVLSRMGTSIKALARPKAARTVAEHILKLCQEQ
ncbi:MAG: undecaprenyldiphospho-muramoylpentapeptide beta-N-acetylglucosaminyltransferase [Desulfovibrionaceae bacterium]|nr:undecaprenyldiphospho-muramoylpentapeptide beta-N-acetylglucosaminyltransferase [Desulfovibrionaceae bacterium]